MEESHYKIFPHTYTLYIFDFKIVFLKENIKKVLPLNSHIIKHIFRPLCYIPRYNFFIHNLVK